MKCTIKEIAEALHLSRNTVAKALSQKSGVSEKTRRLVLTKAKEMNYQLEITENTKDTPQGNPDTILFLTRGSVNYTGFWISVMKGINAALKEHNYTLSLAMMDDEEIQTFKFPSILTNPSIKGLILVELCDPKICEAIIKYGLPTVSIDMSKDYKDLIYKLDVITMENKRCIHQYVDSLYQKGHRSFAFAGDICTDNVGRGFQERYEAVCESLEEHGLHLDTTASLLHETDQQLMNINYIVHFLKELDHLPDAYFCGNDWTAIQLMHAIQFLGYSVPKDISIIGFDNITESVNTIPPLTTVNTPKEQLGIAAARCILDRIKDPQLPYVYSQYNTTAVVRGSADL